MSFSSVAPSRIQCTKMVHIANTILIGAFGNISAHNKLNATVRDNPTIDLTENHFDWLQHAFQLGIVRIYVSYRIQVSGYCLRRGCEIRLLNQLDMDRACLLLSSTETCVEAEFMYLSLILESPISCDFAYLIY